LIRAIYVLLQTAASEESVKEKADELEKIKAELEHNKLQKRSVSNSLFSNSYVVTSLSIRK